MLRNPNKDFSLIPKVHRKWVGPLPRPSGDENPIRQRPAFCKTPRIKDSARRHEEAERLRGVVVPLG
ncbi:hypothetical protein J6590_065728 [Homalodisca vitripennis]|nr:hypothetical protein J6590_065728 [Homalodisca vitripennis]